MFRQLLWVILGVAAAWLTIQFSGCGNASPLGISRGSQGPGTTAASWQEAPPSLEELRAILLTQLSARGVDPDRQTRSAPTAGNEVIDLEWEPYDPDGAGGSPPEGYVLTWSERLVGDYDMNGLVNISDLTPIALHWQKEIQYDPPYFHFGVDYYPAGDPEFDGDVGPGQPPTPESGASNWRMARVDGDGNGVVNISDLTPLGLHFGEELSGYHIYRRDPDQTNFELLMDPANPAVPLLVRRESINYGAGVDQRRPCIYSYSDQITVEGECEYRVAPFDANSNEEGPASLGGLEEIDSVEAALTADIRQGEPPLTVQFDASGTATFGGAEIAAFLWDLDADGIIDHDTGTEPTISHTFTSLGAWTVSVDVYATDGDSSVASLLISVTQVPVAKLILQPDETEVPLTLVVDAGTSFDHDGEVVRFEWDMDNDGEYELDTGPVSQRVLDVTETGSITIGVLVTDNCGAQDEDTITRTFVDEYDEIENNDSMAQAMPLGELAVGAQVSGISGGIGPLYYDGDAEDWFSFDVTDGVSTAVTLNFAHANSDLRLELYDAGGDPPLAVSATDTDNEALSTRLLCGGTYYVRVSREEGSSGGNAEYSLSIEIDELYYDEIEDNDTVDEPQDLGSISATMLDDFWGNLGEGGYDGDTEDWYRFTLDLDAEYRISAVFYHSFGDIELQLYTSDGGTLVGAAHSVNDNETIVEHLAAGSYALRCYLFEGQTANYWLSILYD